MTKEDYKKALRLACEKIEELKTCPAWNIEGWKCLVNRHDEDSYDYCINCWELYFIKKVYRRNKIITWITKCWEQYFLKAVKGR